MCENNDFTFQFSFDQLSFRDAADACRRRRGTLARDGLGSLNRCFSAQNKHYWIDYVENRSCMQSGSGKYSWSGENECRSPSFVRIFETVTNNNECQALQLSVQFNNPTSRPQAFERNCDITAHYICQIPRPTTTKPVTTPTSRKTTTTTQITSRTTLTSFPTESAEAMSSEVTGINPGVIAAVIICCLLLLMLLIFLYLWRCKNFDLKKLKSLAISKNSTPTEPIATNYSSTTENHFYH